ncbi:MAG: hypothetical protein MUC54_06965 [Chloroflexi bacterium]|nr:hypothetical protein [Chloroflexota bacterium]
MTTDLPSFYVVFDSASSAVRCGLSIVAAAATAQAADETAAPIEVGVGVHARATPALSPPRRDASLRIHPAAVRSAVANWPPPVEHQGPRT